MHHLSGLPARRKDQLLVPVPRNRYEEILCFWPWFRYPAVGRLQLPHVLLPPSQLSLLPCHTSDW